MINPGSTGGSESLVDGSFVEREMTYSGLMVNRAGIHSFDELHDRVTKISVASENGGFDRGSTAILWEERRVDIEDADRLEGIK